MPSEPLMIDHSLADADIHAFADRALHEGHRLEVLLRRIYGNDPRLDGELTAMLTDITHYWHERSPALKKLDAERLADPEWFLSNRMLGGVCYVDRYAGSLAGLHDRIPYFRELGLTYLHLMPLFLAPQPNSDGGYAVSSYREVDPAIGTMDELRDAGTALRESGISLAVDFVFNHTSNEHEWARKAFAGDPDYADFYWIYDDREMPDAFESTSREIFPDDHPGSFVQLDDGRWVWTTFHSFQWDLNYSNPAVFRAMAGEMLFLANQGIDVLRMDAVAFIWKKLGTASENLPEAHLLLQAFNAVCRIAAPSVLFLSEAIVHPDDVVEYMSPGECQLSYNPLQMALLWNTLATREVDLLALALERRHATPPGTSWVNYVRSHDDIGWTFADEDARELGVDGFDHRRFLNRFYANRFDGSFARGVPFQDNPKTGDSRVSGTTASLAGLEAGDPGAIRRILLSHSIAISSGGMPLLYLGDEVGQLNDYSYVDDPGHSDDSRWVGRPAFPAELYAARSESSTSAGKLYAGIRRMLELRRSYPEFAGGALIPFDTNNRHVLGYQRPGLESEFGSTILVLANFGDGGELVSPRTLSALPRVCVDLVSGARRDLADGIALGPQCFAWLRAADLS